MPVSVFAGRYDSVAPPEVQCRLAEQIPGATGQQKLAASVQIAQAGFAAAQAAGAHVDANAASEALLAGVSAVVQGANAFHK